MPQHINNGQAGFTVLEALVALAILTTITASVLSLVSIGQRSAVRSRERLINTIQAQALLERVGLDFTMELGVRTGFSPDGRPWRIEITPFSDEYRSFPEYATPLYNINIQVSTSSAQDDTAILSSIRREGRP